MIDNTRFSVRQMELEVENLAAEYADTSTAGTIGRAEGNYAARFKALCYYDDVADLPVEKTFKNLVFQTVSGAGSTTGWNSSTPSSSRSSPTSTSRATRKVTPTGRRGTRPSSSATGLPSMGLYRHDHCPDATVIWPVQE
jgi:hypothetical protein